MGGNLRFKHTRRAMAKAFKKGSQFSVKTAIHYDGEYEFDSMDEYVQQDFCDCSPSEKKCCTSDELEILDEAEAMSQEDRDAKVQEAEAALNKKQMQADKVVQDAKASTKKFEKKKLKKQAEELTNEVDDLAKKLELYRHASEL